VEAETLEKLLEDLRQTGIEPALVVDISYGFFDALMKNRDVGSIKERSIHVLNKDDGKDDAEDDSTEDKYYKLLNIKLRLLPWDCLSGKYPFVGRFGRFRAVKNLYEVYTGLEKELTEGTIRSFVQFRRKPIQKDSPKSIPASESEVMYMERQETQEFLPFLSETL
jgi:hypothetical protein